MAVEMFQKACDKSKYVCPNTVDSEIELTNSHICGILTFSFPARILGTHFAHCCLLISYSACVDAAVCMSTQRSANATQLKDVAFSKTSGCLLPDASLPHAEIPKFE